MNRTVLKRVSALLLPILLCVGCVSLTETPADTLGGVLLPVLDRHDAYALAIGGPEDAQVTSWLQDSAGLRRTLLTGPGEFVTAPVSNGEVKASIGRVTARHDEWVKSDLTATELQKRVWLRSAALSRELVEMVAGE